MRGGIRQKRKIGCNSKVSVRHLSHALNCVRKLRTASEATWTRPGGFRCTEPSDFSYWQLAASGRGVEEADGEEKGGEPRRMWKKREVEGKGKAKRVDSSSIYTSSHSLLPETGAFPSKPGIDARMSFERRMKTRRCPSPRPLDAFCSHC